MLGNYSAERRVGDNWEFFTGEDDKGKFKIVCPDCKAEGSSLEHDNWYMSKESDEDLIIRCKKCGNKTDVMESELVGWKVRIEK